MWILFRSQASIVSSSLEAGTWSVTVIFSGNAFALHTTSRSDAVQVRAQGTSGVSLVCRKCQSSPFDIAQSEPGFFWNTPAVSTSRSSLSLPKKHQSLNTRDLILSLPGETKCLRSPGYRGSSQHSTENDYVRSQNYLG